MNPNNDIERKRLFDAIELSYRQLRPFRTLMQGLTEEYVGPDYGTPGTYPRYEMVANLCNQAVDAYVMSLVANRPRVLASSRNPACQSFAMRYQIAMNNLIQEIELEKVLRQAVMDAFFGVGIVRVHMAESVQVEVEEGIWMDPGKAFVSSVSLQDFVFDMSVDQWHKIKFAANTYRIPFADLEADIFDRKIVKLLTPTPRESGSGESERLLHISAGREVDGGELEPMIDLMDVWVPREGKVFTFALEDRTRLAGKHPPVAVLDEAGPETGPYKILSFADVPGNIMSVGPASHLATLSRQINNALRKQSRGARSFKRVHTYTPAGEEAARTIRNAANDEWIKVAEASEIGEKQVGGIDPAMEAYITSRIALFDRMAGNLTTLLGLGVQAETVGQEQLINTSASKKIAQMQSRVADFTRDIVRHLGFLLWNDVVRTIPGRMDIEGADGYSVDMAWTPDLREGEYDEYELDIDVYSMPHQTPGQRLAFLNSAVTQIYIPLAQQLAAEGGSVSLRKLVDIQADLAAEPRLREIIQFTGAVPEPTEGEGPRSTSREYIRRSVPTGGSPEGRAHVQQQDWMALAKQQQPTAV